MTLGGDPRDTAIADLFACFARLNAVAVAEVSESGQLVRCNDGFQRLLDMRSDPRAVDVSDFFVQPRFDGLVATQAQPDEVIHYGVINVGDQNVACRSLIGTVSRNGPNLLLVAEYDIAEMEMLNAQVIALNEQLTEVQRDLARKERRLRASEERLRALSQTDPMTGLANRRGLEEFLERECLRAQRYGEALSIIMADLDHFKRVNDEHGHDVGDEVLQHFARLLRDQMREIDLVARIGGEEFLVVVPMTGLAAATETAERLRRHTCAMAVSALPDGVSASFGVALWRPGDTITSVLKNVDDALYAAKHKGRNRVEAYVAPVVGAPRALSDRTQAD